MKGLQEAYSGKTVVVTGNTGFKGSWLCLWLTKLGANVIGISHKEFQNDQHFKLLNLGYRTIYCDIRKNEELRKILRVEGLST